MGEPQAAYFTLHGVLIGLLSLVVWFVLNVLSTVLFHDFGWQALTPNLAIALVLVYVVMCAMFESIN